MPFATPNNNLQALAASQRHSDSCVPTLDDGVEMMIEGESYRAAGCLQASRAYAASCPSILQPARRLCTAHSARSTRDLPARSRPDEGWVLTLPPVGAVLSYVPPLPTSYLSTNIGTKASTPLRSLLRGRIDLRFFATCLGDALGGRTHVFGLVTPNVPAIVIAPSD